MKVLTTIDLLALPSLKTPPTGHVGFGAKSDGLYQKVGTVETKLSIDGHTHTIAQITGLQGALDSKATQSDIDIAVENLEIGGRNLLLNTKNERSGTYVMSPSYILTEKPIVGESYTLSGWFKFSEGKLKRIMAYNSGGWISLFSWTNNAWPYDEWFYFSKTFTWRNGASADDTYVNIYGGENDGLLSYAKLIKLEKGNKATDWTPAPEDQVSDWNVTDVNSFAFIKNKPTQLSQFTDNIGVASHIANKANPHAVTTSQIGAVDLTTNQTIGGVKTFTGNVTAPTFIGALSGNATSATKLQTARTIAGVLFDGTANIAIPFANLASKPTTLSGYGITDAVTLNTAQTITGAKTFSTLLTASAGVNTPKVDFGNGFTVEPSGTELVFKYNGVIKQRMLSDGSIVATGELTAYS